MNIFGKKPAPKPLEEQIKRVAEARARMPKMPPRGSDPDLTRRVSRSIANTNEMLANDDISSRLPDHLVKLLERIHNTQKEQEVLVGEMEADVLEMEQIFDDGYRKGVLPLDRSLAANADANLRNLKKFDKETAREEEEWAREDAPGRSRNR